MRTHGVVFVVVNAAAAACCCCCLLLLLPAAAAACCCCCATAAAAVACAASLIHARATGDQCVTAQYRASTVGQASKAGRQGRQAGKAGSRAAGQFCTWTVTVHACVLTHEKRSAFSFMCSGLLVLGMTGMPSCTCHFRATCGLRASQKKKQKKNKQTNKAHAVEQAQTRTRMQ